MPARTITFPFPLSRTHAGIAMGNGSFGALVWGSDRIHITVNRSDFWDHRGGVQITDGMSYARMCDAYDPDDKDNAAIESILREHAAAHPKPADVHMPSRLPMGRFEIVLKRAKPRTGVLNCGTGRLAVHCTAGKKEHTLTLALHPQKDVLLILDPSHIIDSVVCRPAWEWTQEHFSRYGFRAPTSISDKERAGWSQSCPDDPSMAALAERTKDGMYIALARGADDARAFDAAQQSIASCTESTSRIFLTEHAAWWNAYWKDLPSIHIPSVFFMQFYNYALYKFACATNPNGTAAGLQGPWVEEYQPTPWQGDFHFNVNVQEMYALAFSLGRPEHCLPLFDMIDSWHDVLQENARVLCGIDDGLMLGMCVDDRGKNLYLVSGSVIDHAVSGWTAQLYWQYYLSTGDKAFLRDRAYPFMLGVMRVYESMLVEKDGRLTIPIGISAEYRNEKGQSVHREPSYQLACMHMLTDALIDASHVLGIETRAIWHDIKKRAPLYTLIGEKKKRIAVGRDQDLEKCHRHHSHLAAIYPFDSLGDITPEKQELLDDSIDHWILKGMGEWSEWCIPWAAIIQARMGFTESPMLLLNMWREVFVNEGFATVYLPRFRGISAHRRADMMKPKETTEIMQLDGTFGAATAILEMLLHTKNGTTYIFPAIPEGWKDVSFTDIRTGGFLVSAEKKNGRITSVRVRAVYKGKIRLSVPGAASLISNGESYHPLNAIPMDAGEDRIFRAAP